MDLNTWKKGHQLVLEIYKATGLFPKEELFGLSNQLRRAAVSFTSNIAEGFSRNSMREKVHFYAMALGSLTELQNQILIAKDVGYMPNEVFRQLWDDAIVTNKLISGLLRKSKTLTKTA